MAHFRLNCCSLAGRYDFCQEEERARESESGSVVRGRARNEEEGLAVMGLPDRRIDMHVGRGPCGHDSSEWRHRGRDVDGFADLP